MALEYTLQAEAQVARTTMTAFLAAALAGTANPDGTVFREGMYVMPGEVPIEDAHPATTEAGFTEKTDATFRFATIGRELTEDHNTALMVGATIAFFDRFGGRGFLLFNGERIIAQRLDDELVFADDWADYLEGDEVAALVGERPVRKLSQIYL